MAWVATAIAGSAIVGAGASIYGANKASSTQQAAAQQASQVQQQMFNTGAGAVGTAQGGVSGAVANAGTTIPGSLGVASSLLGPYTNLGQNNWTNFNNALPGLTTPFSSSPFSSQAALEATPGYQFTLGQGEKAVTNANSAMGLADSGVEGKGIANYAEGLANTTYQQQFQNYQQQQQQFYNMLFQPAATGETIGAGAAGSLAGMNLQGGTTLASLGLQGAGLNIGGAESLLGGGIQTGAGVGSNIMGGANASAAATMTGANAVGGLGTNALTSYMQYSLLQKLLGPGSSATTTVPPTASALPSPDASTLLGPIQGYSLPQW